VPVGSTLSSSIVSNSVAVLPVDVPAKPESTGVRPDPTSKATSRSGLALALVDFEERAGTKIPHARLGILREDRGTWRFNHLEDVDSNVLHKAFAFQLSTGEHGVVTAGGTRATLKFWKSQHDVEILWESDFGGKFSRMRDVESADVLNEGWPALVVATHDQGVVAVISIDKNGRRRVRELDRNPDTIVHEIEIGDLNADGVLEVYATVSAPNRLDGSVQPGKVLRYVPLLNEGPTCVADLGLDHSKEILVEDVDGDGRDELYVSVEARPGGKIRILRFGADTKPQAGVEVARLPDLLCRFLIAGELDGDGHKEIVASTFKGGLWLLRSSNEGTSWTPTQIDAASGGIQHACKMVDLDLDGVDELYVANDRGSEINRYAWRDGGLVKTTLYKYPRQLVGFTWNIEPISEDLVRALVP
jgi:hypothetical protein